MDRAFPTPCRDEFNRHRYSVRCAAHPGLAHPVSTSFAAHWSRIGHVSDRIQPPVNRLGGEASTSRASIGTIKSGGPFKFETLTLFVTHDDSSRGHST